MRFLADMGISPRTVAFLRGKGFDAVHLSELGLHRMTDREILVKAYEEGFILLTHDLDFGDLLAASGARLPSVMVFRLRNMRPNQVNLYLDQIIARYGNELEAGAFLSVTEGRVRIRLLPLK